MKTKLGDVIRIKARKKAIYKVIEVRANDVLIKRVKKDFSDAGEKSVFRILNSQKDMIVEIIGNSKEGISEKPKTSEKPSSKKVSEMQKDLFTYDLMGDKKAIELLEYLAISYSPENLTCDGELSRSQIAKEKAKFDRKWKAMEMYFGHLIENDIM